jgi:subtilisin family serine protease
MRYLAIVIQFFLGVHYIVNGQEIIPGKLVVKFKNHDVESKFLQDSKSNSLFFQGLVKKFPNHKPIDAYKLNEGFVDLSLIYEVSETKTSTEKTIHYLKNLDLFEYVEPVYKRDFLFTPNDPQLATQYHLNIIKALQAYDIAKGDTNTVIGISDTGVDIAHPDLNANIKRNYADPIDGIDNDFDGYMDNFMGWDLASNDNNPQYQSHVHGVHVSGIASAVTNNSVGIAGVGFNCKFMPLKIMNESGYLTAGYESIVYAADHGCAVVNCSWGGMGYSKYEQDVVTYATVNQNCLVIGAAGNSNSEDPFYPASYKYVLSVAATNQVDKKWDGSSYNEYVDISAPGELIYSTLGGGSYGLSSGTSMAAPVVAGVAGIVKSVYPSLTALQLAELLKSSADLIDTVNSPQFEGKLGTGRVNLLSAISDVSKPGILLQSYNISDNNDEVWVNGDTLFVVCSFKNIMADAKNLLVKISVPSPYVSVLSSYFNVGDLNQWGVVTNNQQVFKLLLKNNIPPNHSFKMVFNYIADNYRSSECVQITANEDLINLTVNNIKTSISSKGYLGYNNFYQSQGLGVIYKNNSLLFNGSLIIGNAITQVSDNLMSDAGKIDEDFFPLLKATRLIDNPISDFDVSSKFDDRMASSSRLNVSVTQKNYAWKDEPNSNFIFYNYKIVNEGITPIGSFYTGLFADWDIKNPELNKAAFINSLNLIYAFSTQPNSPYVGIKILSHGSLIKYYALDMVDDKKIKLDNGFSSEEKFIMLTGNQDIAGNGAGTDVASYLGAGPFNLETYDTLDITFAIVVSDNFTEFINSANAAQQKYNQLFVGSSDLNPADHFQLYPNPSRGYLKIVSPVDGFIEVLSADGKLVKEFEITQNSYELYLSDLNNGCYFVRFVDHDHSKPQLIKKLILNKQ